MSDFGHYRVLASYKPRNKPKKTEWFYWNFKEFRSYGPFGGFIKPQSLTVVDHPRNDPEALEIIAKAKEGALLPPKPEKRL